MRHTFTATLTQEGDWVVAQCLEVNVASQGESEEEALANLREALEFAFEEPHALKTPVLHRFDIETDAA